MYDVVIVGAGPAGLSAALVLGRCRRRVLVVDAGSPRNAAAMEMHGFLTRDCIVPAELRSIGRKQLQRYETVEVRTGTVVAVRGCEGHFELSFHDSIRVRAKKVLLATGVVDELPDVPGLKAMYGKSVFHCPYCDGWEQRDQPLAVYGKHDRGVGLACTLLGWSRDVVLCTDGPAELTSADRGRLERLGIRVRRDKITALAGVQGILRAIVFEEGSELPRRALFFNTGQYQRSQLPALLGYEINDKDSVVTNDHCMTSIPGIYLAGDASRDVQLAIVAAAEGATAAFAINSALLEEEFG